MSHYDFVVAYCTLKRGVHISCFSNHKVMETAHNTLKRKIVVCQLEVVLSETEYKEIGNSPIL